MGWTIQVKKVRIDFPLDVQISDLLAVDSIGNTIASVNRLQTAISLSDIFGAQVLVDSLALEQAHVSLADLIPSMRLQGDVGRFALLHGQVDLLSSRVHVSSLELQSTDVNMALFDSAPDTTTSSSAPLNWAITVDSLVIDSSAYALDMPDMPLGMQVTIPHGRLYGGDMFLYTNEYKVDSLAISGAAYTMHLDSLAPNPKGFDPMHIALKQVEIYADSIYNQLLTNRVNIHQIAFVERSGLQVDQFSAHYAMDSTEMHANEVQLLTPYSDLHATIDLPMSLFDSIPSGDLLAQLQFQFAKQDIAYFIEPYFEPYTTVFPNKPTQGVIDIKGSAQDIQIDQLQLSIPKILHVDGNGQIASPFDVEKAQGKVDFQVALENLNFIKAFLPDSVARDLQIPPQMKLELDVLADKGVYDAHAHLIQDQSTLDISAHYGLKTDTFDVDFAIQQLNIKKIMPSLPIHSLTATLQAQGRGTDPYNPKFLLSTDLKVGRLVLDRYDLTDINLNAALHKQLYTINLDADNPYVQFDLSANGLFQKDSISSQLQAQFASIDFDKLALTSIPLDLAMNLDLEFASDLKQQYAAKLQLDQIVITDEKKKNTMKAIRFDSKINQTQAQLALASGDFSTQVAFEAGFDQILSSFDNFSQTLTQQLNKMQFDYQQLSEILPVFNVQIDAERQNAVSAFLRLNGIGLNQFSLALDNTADNGFSLDTQIEDLQVDTFTIHAIQFDMLQDSSRINYSLHAIKQAPQQNKAFDMLLSGYLQGQDLYLQAKHRDGANKVGLDVGLLAQVSLDDVRLHFQSIDPIILFQPLRVNEDNYVAYRWDRQIQADLEVTGKDDFIVSLHSTDTLQTNDQTRLDVIIQDFKLALISNVLPSVPAFSGLFQTKMQVALAPDSMAVLGSVALDSLVYNKRLLGDIQAPLTYQSMRGRGHYLTSHLNLNKAKVLDVLVDYQPKRSDSIQAKVSFLSLPLKLADPFIPDAMATLSGYANGMVEVVGPITKPIIQGDVALDSASVLIAAANARYYFDEKPLIFKNNSLLFDQYELRAFNENPLVVDGDVDFSNFDEIMADLSVNGLGVELLDVKRRKSGQMVYGVLKMDVATTVSGPVNLLKVRGNIALLGETKVNYVLLDSPVSANNRVDDLVAFTSFADSTQYVKQFESKPLVLSGIDMLLTINIAQQALFGIDLAPKGDDRVELVGGGDLAFRLSSLGEMDLTGRYNLTGGFVNYSLPVLPVAKKFTIRTGSYVEWSGNPMDPFLYLVAYESIRSSVTEEGKGTRVVTFEPMIVIKNSLDDLSLTFDMEVPDDLTIQDQLAQMTAEERSRDAIKMLITQQYDAPGVSSKMNSSNAINSFIQKEINQFAGSMLKGVDLSVGIDSYDEYGREGGGAKRTDYSFRFSKTLFNDRFRIIIGASVSSGEEVSKEDNQAFIDDIALEYMLDSGGNRLIKLFHQQDFEGVLEGDIIKTGVGIVLKRKVDRLGHLFRFRDPNKKKKKNSETTPDKSEKEMQE